MSARDVIEHGVCAHDGRPIARRAIDGYRWHHNDDRAGLGCVDPRTEATPLFIDGMHITDSAMLTHAHAWDPDSPDATACQQSGPHGPRSAVTCPACRPLQAVVQTRQWVYLVNQAINASRAGTLREAENRVRADAESEAHQFNDDRVRAADAVVVWLAVQASDARHERDANRARMRQVAGDPATYWEAERHAAAHGARLGAFIEAWEHVTGRAWPS